MFSEDAFREKMGLEMSAFCKRRRKKMVRIYVALLSKTEQPKPVLSCQHSKTLYFGSSILVFRFSPENAMLAMENVDRKLAFFFSPVVIHSSPLPPEGAPFPPPVLSCSPVSTPCAETETAPLQEPVTGTAARGSATGNIDQDTLS